MPRWCVRVCLVGISAVSLLGLVATGLATGRSPHGGGASPSGLGGVFFRANGLTIPTGYSSDGSAENQAAARRDAPSLLAKVNLPNGASRLTSEPSGDNGYLKSLEALEGDEAHAVASGWWQVPATPRQVIGFVKQHPPAGAKQSGTGGGANSNTGTSSVSVYFQWPAVPGVLGPRTVLVTATSLPGGDTGVLVEAQSDWVVLRPSSERIPSAVRTIELTSAALGEPGPSIALRVTRRSQVAAIVRLINWLPVAQPVTYGCPALINPRVIKLRFEAGAGAPLAVLTYMDYYPWLSPSIGCKPIGLMLAGQRQDPLLGGGFLKALTAIVGKTLV
jgi:hypothetical protein